MSEEFINQVIESVFREKEPSKEKVEIPRGLVNLLMIIRLADELSIVESQYNKLIYSFVKLKLNFRVNAPTVVSVECDGLRVVFDRREIVIDGEEIEFEGDYAKMKVPQLLRLVKRAEDLEKIIKCLEKEIDERRNKIAGIMEFLNKLKEAGVVLEVVGI